MDSSATAASNRSPEIEDAIRRRAEMLYEQRGRTPGHEVEDWVQAEREVVSEVERSQKPKLAFVVVRLEGATYTGEYDSKCCDEYAPGEFRTGAPVEVRFHLDKMYLKRPNRKELETRIVRKVIGT